VELINKHFLGSGTDQKKMEDSHVPASGKFMHSHHGFGT